MNLKVLRSYFRRLYDSIIILMIIGLSVSQYLCYHHDNKKVILVQDVVPEFYFKSPREGLMDALKYYDVKHRDIVYAQAVLETGHFQSKNCLHKNNLFGISYKGKVVSFNHWVSSVIAYKERVQYKYKFKGFSTNEKYYHFLDTLGYAEDPMYTKKIRNIVKRYAR